MIEFIYIGFWIMLAFIYAFVWTRAYEIHQSEGGTPTKEIFAPSMLIWAHAIFLFIQPAFFIGVVLYFCGNFYWRSNQGHLQEGREAVFWLRDYYANEFPNINGIIVEWPVKVVNSQVICWEGQWYKTK